MAFLWGFSFSLSFFLKGGCMEKIRQNTGWAIDTNIQIDRQCRWTLHHEPREDCGLW